ncbi:MAG: DUF2442 domain-containing protein [Chitinophagaceae bacterium]|nr:MAG: DUF2442 domain-containing protein [Chitinophagaceae bacterium]
MSTSNNIRNKHSNDSFDRLIFEKKLRAKTLIIDKELDVLLILFNTGNVLKGRLSDYPKLKTASNAELEDWRLIKDGIGIRWESLDEDLSIKGFIKKFALNQALRSLKSNGDDEILFA